jgi:hypothetical protein
MMKRLFLYMGILCFFLTACHQVDAQSVVRGMIKDANEKVVEFANILLLKSTDSSLVKGMITDATGKYLFENISNGRYLLSATYTGMSQEFSPVFEVSENRKDIEMVTIHLHPAEVKLNAVKVDAKKPMFEQKIDRMVINVKNSITSAGGTALDVLEKSPGVTVNRQNNTIAVNGKN